MYDNVLLFLLIFSINPGKEVKKTMPRRITFLDKDLSKRNVTVVAYQGRTPQNVVDGANDPCDVSRDVYHIYGDTRIDSLSNARRKDTKKQEVLTFVKEKTLMRDAEGVRNWNNQWPGIKHLIVSVLGALRLYAKKFMYVFSVLLEMRVFKNIYRSLLPTNCNFFILVI